MRSRFLWPKRYNARQPTAEEAASASRGRRHGLAFTSTLLLRIAHCTVVWCEPCERSLTGACVTTENIFLAVRPAHTGTNACLCRCENFDFALTWPLTLTFGCSGSHRTMERSTVDRNSSNRSRRSSSRFDQQRSVVSGSGSGAPQTDYHQQQPSVHAHHQHMSGVPQPPPPPPASTSRSAHKEVPATSTAVTPEETLATRRSKRISAMAQHSYYGSDYPSSGKLLLAFRYWLAGEGKDFHGNPGKILSITGCMLYVVHLSQSAECQKNSLPIAQRHASECVSRVNPMRLSIGQQIPETPHDFC